MALIVGRQSLNNIILIEVDGDPAASTGTTAPLGSLATQIDGSGLWLKTGAADTAWSAIATTNNPSTEGMVYFATADGVGAWATPVTSVEPGNSGWMVDESGNLIVE